MAPEGPRVKPEALPDTNELELEFSRRFMAYDRCWQVVELAPRRSSTVERALLVLMDSQRLVGLSLGVVRHLSVLCRGLEDG